MIVFNKYFRRKSVLWDKNESVTKNEQWEWKAFFREIEYISVCRVFHSVEDAPPISWIVFDLPPPQSELVPPMGLPHLKMKPPPLKNKALFQKMIPSKKNPKNRKLSLTLVFHLWNNTASLVKQHWKDMTKFHKNVIFSLGAFKIL